MRYQLTAVTAALLLASATFANAQPTPAPSTAPTPAATAAVDWTGSIDLGFRSDSTTGDVARYERYRDLRDGSASRLTIGKATDQFIFKAGAENIGYHDQRYSVDYSGGKAKVSFLWDSTPLNYSYLTSTPWVEASPGVLTLSTAARAQVQAKAPGIVGVPQSAANLLTPSIYRGLAQSFDLQQRRDSANFALTYNATKELGLNLSFNSTKKLGHQPWGASFAFNVADEVPLPLDNRANDVSAGLEWANSDGMMRVAWDGSWFTNNIKELVWDNPYRLTDQNPIDASGYSNGNGPARGRMSVAPSSSMNAVSLTGLYKMPSHTTISGIMSFTNMSQNDALIPWTINPVISPLMQALPRGTAEAKVHGLNGLFTFTSRPNNFFGLSMRYRFNDHQNLTPEFDATNYVRFDAVPESTGGLTEQFDIRQNTFDLTGTFRVAPYTSLRVGYIYDDFNRTGRAFSDMRDYTFRTSLDTVGGPHVTIRAIVEHTTRIGSGFSEASLEDGGSQPGLRFYDEADRDRNRGTLLFIVTPVSMVDFTVSASTGKDVYSGPGHELGLLNNDNTSYNAGFNINPMAHVNVGASYGYDKFSSLQASRNANPPGTDYGSWTDPNRRWNLNNDESVKNFNLYVDVLKAIQKTDLRLAYDYSDSDNAFIHSGPRIQELATNTALTAGDAKPCAAGLTSCFEALPSVTNKWQRFTIDLKYFATPKVGFGVGYWYEKLDVADYAAIDISGQPGTPRIDYLGEISTGYGTRPYKGNTAFIRVLYLF